MGSWCPLPLPYPLSSQNLTQNRLNALRLKSSGIKKKKKNLDKLPTSELASAYTGLREILSARHWDCIQGVR